MSFSFLSISPISIRLGLLHSLFSIFSFSFPMIMCAYVLWKYGEKYGRHAYLAVTIGQTLFYLFLFYAPYCVTIQWCYWEPFITLFGACFTWYFLRRMNKKNDFDKFSNLHYFYFSFIMFMNPLRLGNGNTFPPILLNIFDQNLTFLYCIFYAIPYFFFNFQFGIAISYILNNTLFCLKNEKRINQIFFILSHIPFVYLFFGFSNTTYCQYPLARLGVPIQLEISSPIEIPIIEKKNNLALGKKKSEKIERISLIELIIFAREKQLNILPLLVHYLQQLYNDFFSTLQYEENLMLSDVDFVFVDEPIWSKHFTAEDFVFDKIESVDDDQPEPEFMNQQVSSIHEREYLLNFFFMTNFWVEREIQLYEANYLYLNSVVDLVDEDDFLLYEPINLRGASFEDSWWSNEIDFLPIRWIRSLGLPNRGISHFKKSILPFLHLKPFLTRLIHDEVIYEKTEVLLKEKEKFSLSTQIENIEEEFDKQIPFNLSKWFFEMKQSIEDEILLEKKIDKKNLTSKQVEILNLLTTKIIQQEVHEILNTSLKTLSDFKIENGFEEAILGGIELETPISESLKYSLKVSELLTTHNFDNFVEIFALNTEIPFPFVKNGKSEIKETHGKKNEKDANIEEDLVQVYFSTLELKEIEKKENDSTFIINKNEKITKNFLFDSYIDLIELIDDIEYDFESILLLTKTMDFFGFEKNIKTNLNMKRIVEFSTNDLEKKIAKKGGHPLTVKKNQSALNELLVKNPQGKITRFESLYPRTRLFETEKQKEKREKKEADDKAAEIEKKEKEKQGKKSLFQISQKSESETSKNETSKSETSKSETTKKSGTKVFVIGKDGKKVESEQFVVGKGGEIIDLEKQQRKLRPIHLVFRRIDNFQENGLSFPFPKGYQREFHYYKYIPTQKELAELEELEKELSQLKSQQVVVEVGGVVSKKPILSPTKGKGRALGFKQQNLLQEPPTSKGLISK